MEKLIKEVVQAPALGGETPPARLWVSISVAALATVAALCSARAAHSAVLLAIPMALWLGVAFDWQARVPRLLSRPSITPTL